MFDSSKFTQNSIQNNSDLICDWSHLANAKTLGIPCCYGQVPQMCFSPDGLLIAYKSSPLKIQMIETKTGQCIDTDLTTENRQNDMQFSSDSRFLIYVDNNRIKFWDTIQRKHLFCHQLSEKEGLKHQISLSPIGPILACQTIYGQIMIWDYQKSNLLKDLGHCQELDQVIKFSCNGNVFLKYSNLIKSANSKREYRLENVLRTKREVKNFKCSPNEKMLIVIDWRKRMTLHDLKSKKQLRRFDQSCEYYSIEVQFSPNGEKLLYTVYISDFQFRMRILKINSGYHFDVKYPVYVRRPAAHFSPDGRYVVFTRSDNTMHFRIILQRIDDLINCTQKL